MPAITASRRRDTYEEQGFVIVRELYHAGAIRRALDEAIALLDRHALISTRNLRCRWQTNVRTGECEFETFDPIIDLSPACGVLANDSRLLAVLAELYGEPAALFKDKLIYKPPGCPGYGLHQDWIGWPGFPRSFLTVLVPLDAAVAANGCTVVYPGYHQRGSLSPEDGQYHPLPDGTVDESLAVPLELQPGDAAIFTGFTPHRSAPNHSDGWRRQLYLSYNKMSDGGEQRDAHYAEFHQWLRQRYAEYDKHDLYFE
jgi:ectoine hydroxylase-related dioxygenase (phytanoyl-CoA dioxygenase family)